MRSEYERESEFRTHPFLYAGTICGMEGNGISGSGVVKKIREKLWKYNKM